MGCGGTDAMAASTDEATVLMFDYAYSLCAFITGFHCGPVHLCLAVAPDDADVQAFDREAVDTARIDLDRFEVRIFGQQQKLAATVLQALDRDLVIEPRDDDAAIVGGLRCDARRAGRRR